MLRLPILLLALGASGSLAWSPAEPTAEAGLDARPIATDVPARVATDQVFEAKITVENTGTKAWGDGMKLRSQDPLDSSTWGTSFIYMGQGRSLEPGGQLTFTSFLKAPGSPGRYAFRWRMARIEDGAMFGEPTALQHIVVEPRGRDLPAVERPGTAREPPPESPPGGRPFGKRVVTAGDLEYVGSFRVAEEVQGHGSAFTESGLALRKAEGGERRLFLRAGLGRSILYEAAIPALVPLRGGDPSSLETASVRRVWGEIRLPRAGEEGIEANAGFWWDEERRTLFWSSYHGYMTGRLPVLGASRLEEDGSVVHHGPWYVPDSVPWYKCYWGGVISLPEDFAERYTGGRTLALGFGGYYSICASASKGPALAAVRMPDLAPCALDSVAGSFESAARALDMLELLAYPWSLEAWAPRDGDYFVANCPWGGRPPEGPASGSWTMDDSVRAGVFIDGPDAHAFLAFAFLGTGRIGYDYGSIRSAGDACHWYFYDPEDLGNVAKGERKPWDLVPRSRFKVEYPRGVRDGSPWGPGPGDVTGACFDAETRLLYIYQRFSIDTGTRELFPCVHAYRLK